jgi:hypothetical protein
LPPNHSEIEFFEAFAPEDLISEAFTPEAFTPEDLPSTELIHLDDEDKVADEDLQQSDFFDAHSLQESTFSEIDVADLALEQTLDLDSPGHTPNLEIDETESEANPEFVIDPEFVTIEIESRIVEPEPEYEPDPEGVDQQVQDYSEDLKVDAELEDLAEALVDVELEDLAEALEHRYRSEAHGIQEIKGSSKQESDITQRS